MDEAADLHLADHRREVAAQVETLQIGVAAAAQAATPAEAATSMKAEQA
jgi:hypothetical protein